MTLFGAATLIAAFCAVGILIVIAWYLTGISDTLTNLNGSVTVREGSHPPEASSRSVKLENERPSEAGAATTFGVRAPNRGAPISAEAVATRCRSCTEDAADGPGAAREVSA